MDCKGKCNTVKQFDEFCRQEVRAFNKRQKIADLEFNEKIKQEKKAFDKMMSEVSNCEVG